MAEGFARHIGKDVVRAYSAGSRPSGNIDPTAVTVMSESGIDISENLSKGFKEFPALDFDYVVGMGCGDVCPMVHAKKHIIWKIDDPKGKDINFFRMIRDNIKGKITDLVEEIKMKSMIVTIFCVLFYMASSINISCADMASDDFLRQGIDHAKQGMYKEAISELTKAIESDPNDADAYYNRAIVYENSKELKAAINDYTRSIQLNAKNSGAYSGRGGIYAAQNDLYNAVRDLNMAIALNPMDAYAYYKRGLIYDSKSDLVKALSDFDKAIDTMPGIADVYVSRGFVYYKKGDTDKAISNYNIAISIDPNNARAYNNRSVAYYYKKEYDKSLSDYQRAKALGYDVSQKFKDMLDRSRSEQVK
jgi:tetratricopeptide (TPR) repeat protein